MAGMASRPAHAGAAHGMGLLGASCGRLLGLPWALPPARGLWPPAGAVILQFISLHLGEGRAVSGMAVG